MESTTPGWISHPARLLTGKRDQQNPHRSMMAAMGSERVPLKSAAFSGQCLGVTAGTVCSTIFGGRSDSEPPSLRIDRVLRFSILNDSTNVLTNRLGEDLARRFRVPGRVGAEHYRVEVVKR